MKFDTLKGFADHLRKIHNRNLKLCFVSILQMVGDAAQKEARDRIIGRIRPLDAIPPFNAWQPLQDSTIAQKAKKGWGKDGDPRSILYATGVLAASVQYRVEKGKLRVVLYSNDPVAAYQEYGTIHIPPRPFIGPAMITTMTRLYPKIESMFVRTLKGKRIS